MIYVINDKYKVPEGAEVINTTSRSNSWGRGLSPFLLGPCDLYDGYIAQNVENGWQFSKVFSCWLENDDSVGERYFRWAQKGWNDKHGHRHPMGRDYAPPLYSYWAGEKLGYVEARKKIYIPLYSKAVEKTKAFAELQKEYDRHDDIYLWCFDAHNLTPGTYSYLDLWNNPNISVGHAYILAMMLEGQ